MDATFWVAQWLHQFGHLKEEPNEKMTMANLRDALASIQGFDANADNFAQAHHGRAIQPDGEFGPATAQLLSTPRCGHPDLVTEEATGSGSWPVPGCNPDDPERNSRHSVRLFVDRRRATDKQKGYLDKCILGAQHCCAEAGLQVYLVNNRADAELSIAFESISGNVIGYFYLYNLGANTCNEHLTGMLDVNYQPDWYQFCLLLIHEALGHGLGHQHTSGGIMNPSLLRTPPNPNTGWPTYKDDGASGNTAWRRMSSWFGGEAVPVPGDDPGPGPGPDPDGVYVSGELHVRNAAGESMAGPLIIVPK